MSSIHNDQLIKELPPNTSRQSLRIAILPRLPIRSQNWSTAKSRNCLDENITEFLVAI
jgi:hypothetical protein